MPVKFIPTAVSFIILSDQTSKKLDPQFILPINFSIYHSLSPLEFSNPPNKEVYKITFMTDGSPSGFPPLTKQTTLKIFYFGL